MAGIVAVHQRCVSIEVVIYVSALKSLYGRRHLVALVGNLVGIEVCVVYTAFCPLLIFPRSFDNVADSLDDTAILARECSFCLCSRACTIVYVRTLLRDEHRVFAAAEVVVLNESVRSLCSTYTVLRVSVEIVVVDMYRHSTDTRVA